MPTPPLIDLEALLAPISPEQPAGRSVVYDLEYDAIRDARRSEDASFQGDWRRDVKAADWDKVISLGSDCLAHRSKDLQIAAWMTEALARRHGLAGLRDGFRLMEGIQERYWETYHPEIEDGDLESRFGPFLFLNDPKQMPFVIRNTPLTGPDGPGPYSYLRYQESRDFENEVRRDPDRASVLEREGKIRAEEFDGAVAQTAKAFYARLLEDLTEANAAFRGFERSTDERFGRDAPSLLNLGRALDEVRAFVEPVLAAKRAADPDPEPEGEDQSEDRDLASDAEIETSDPDLQAQAPRGLRDPSRGRNGLELGVLLIELRERARTLAEVGDRLKENRERYDALVEELRDLDREYESMARELLSDRDLPRALSRLLEQYGSKPASP